MFSYIGNLDAKGDIDLDKVSASRAVKAMFDEIASYPVAPTGSSAGIISMESRTRWLKTVERILRFGLLPQLPPNDDEEEEAYQYLLAKTGGDDHRAVTPAFMRMVVNNISKLSERELLDEIVSLAKHSETETDRDIWSLNRAVEEMREKLRGENDE